MAANLKAVTGIKTDLEQAQTLYWRASKLGDDFGKYRDAVIATGHIGENSIHESRRLRRLQLEIK